MSDMQEQVTETEFDGVLKLIVDDGHRKIKELSIERDRLREINRELIEDMRTLRAHFDLCHCGGYPDCICTPDLLDKRKAILKKTKWVNNVGGAG